MSNEQQDFNPEIATALKIIRQTDAHLFLTGRAGTGKTTFLHSIKKQKPKGLVVLAPTGIAAINAGGQTIHSFFQINPNVPFIPNSKNKDIYHLRDEKIRLIRSLELLVIDEISMVRADLLDNIDERLRILRRTDVPFGGVQLLMIGDLQQLAPIVTHSEQHSVAQRYSTPYFFSSLALQKAGYLSVELSKIYRQSDDKFISLLNHVRNNTADAAVLEELNKQYLPNFQPPEHTKYIRLVTHNRQANAINEQNLQALTTDSHIYTASVIGNFPEHSYPTELEIELKVGAQVMFIKNDPQKRFVNGTLAEVIALEDDAIRARLEDNDAEIRVEAAEWLNTSYTLDKATNEITEKREGVFRQIPLRLAWAITIHKSQGLTFSHAIIDAAEAFAPGQTYVALSRCKTLEGMVLSKPIPPSAIMSDYSVKNFTENLHELTPTQEQLEHLSQHYFIKELSNLFDFDKLTSKMMHYLSTAEEHFKANFKTAIAELNKNVGLFNDKITLVYPKFLRQMSSIFAENPNYSTNEKLQERIARAADYFYEELENLSPAFKENPFFSDNKEIASRIFLAWQNFGLEYALKKKFLKYIIEHKPFDLLDFLHFRALLFADEMPEQKPQKPQQPKKISVAADVKNKALFDKLFIWRRNLANEENIPAYCIASTTALMGIADNLPRTKAEFLKIKGCGNKTFQLYGEQILKIVADFLGDDNFVFVEEKTENSKLNDTSTISLEMFKNGKQIEEIARERNLAISTIYSHLRRAVAMNLLEMEDLIPAERLSPVMDFFEQNPEALNWEFAQIKEALGETFNWNEVYAIRHYLREK